MSNSDQAWHAIFQPMVHVKENMHPEIKDYEMLLRNPEGRFPGQEFLDDILTRSGNLKWIKTTIPALRDALKDHPERRIYINIDPGQLTFDEVWGFLAETHQKYGKQVAIEITERRKLIPDIRYFYEEFHRLKKMGFELAIDDVSSGANSYEFVSRHLEDINRIKLSLLIFKHSSIETAMQFAKAWLDFAKENNITFVLEGVDSTQVAKSFAGNDNVLQQGFYWNDRVHELVE